MKTTDFFRRFESDGQILQCIAGKFAPSSAEAETLRRAGFALMYVVMHCPDEFETFVSESDAKLSDAERAEIRERYGIEQ